MADNVTVTPGAGITMATDDVGGIHFQRVKPAFGADGSASDVSPSNPLPVAARCFGKTGNTVSLTASTASARVALVTASGAVRVFNAGDVTAFIEFGSSAVTAALGTSIPLPAGAVETFAVSSVSHLAAIVASGSAQIYATPGEGI